MHLFGITHTSSYFSLFSRALFFICVTSKKIYHAALLRLKAEFPMSMVSEKPNFYVNLNHFYVETMPILTSQIQINLMNENYTSFYTFIFIAAFIYKKSAVLPHFCYKQYQIEYF